MPEALAAAAAGQDLKDGSHPRPPMQMPSGLDKALVGFSFPDYDRKASMGVSAWACVASSAAIGGTVNTEKQ